MNRNELAALSVNDVVQRNSSIAGQGNMIVTSISGGAITCQVIGTIGTTSVTIDYTELQEVRRVAGT